HRARGDRHHGGPRSQRRSAPRHARRTRANSRRDHGARDAGACNAFTAPGTGAVDAAGVGGGWVTRVHARYTPTHSGVEPETATRPPPILTDARSDRW